MLADVYVASVCWLLAAVFAVACKHKLTAWARFKASFSAYRLVPEPLAAPSVALLVVCELAVVVALALLFTPGLVLAAALLTLYGGAIAVNVARGRTNIDCGCGDEPAPVSVTLVLRNVVLAGAALAAYALAPALALGWLTAAIGLAAGGVAFGLYLAVEQLIANRARHRRLWLGIT